MATKKTKKVTNKKKTVTIEDLQNKAFRKRQTAALITFKDWEKGKTDTEVSKLLKSANMLERKAKMIKNIIKYIKNLKK